MEGLRWGRRILAVGDSGTAGNFGRLRCAYVYALAVRLLEAARTRSNVSLELLTCSLAVEALELMSWLSSPRVLLYKWNINAWQHTSSNDGLRHRRRLGSWGKA